MRSLIRSLFLLVSGASFVAASGTFMHGINGLVHDGSLFGVPRGGGLFGGAKNEKKTEAEAATKYPPMSQEEIEAWLDHIPVFAVTDANGAGLVLKPDNDTSVFYFFMSASQANATLQQIQSTNEETTDLRVSAFSLGKIWFTLLNSNPDKEVKLKTPGSDDATAQAVTGVEYRLVPDTRDLLGARMLLTMTPEDGEKLKDGQPMTQEIAQAALKKAMTEAPKFNATYNEIPVFTISQMRMQKQQEEGEEGEPLTLLPMYFSLQSMIGTWQQFMTGAPEGVQNVEPAINLLSLHDLVEMMQRESEIDFRHVVLVPATPLAGDGEAASLQEPDPLQQMGGATLGDI